MKKNLLPDMVGMALTDREGREARINVAVRKYQGRHYVFLADDDRYSLSAIARNTAVYLVQVAERLKLNVASSFFFRHIYTDESGSLFGQFDVQWEDDTPVSYTLKMLSDLEQLRGIQRIIDNGEPVKISSSQRSNAVEPV